MNDRLSLGRVGFLLLVALAVSLGTTPAIKAQEGTVADRLAEALDLYNDLEYDAGLKVADGLLTRSNLTSHDSVAIFEVLSIITYAKGKAYLQESIGYLNKISSVGACIMPMPRDIWPQELRDRWYEFLREQNQLVCDQTDKDVITIAIMPFDNFSTGEFQDKLGGLGRGLADFFAYDFAKISTFTVVERDKIEFIMKEIELQKSGAVDRASAVKVGKILGAKYMVFGSITQIDRREARMVVRVVSVETSEILAQADREGAPQFSKMEKELVQELSGMLNVTLSSETIDLIKEGGTESLDAASHYALGLDFMDQYDYKQAYEHFKNAYDLDNNFVEAKRKMEIYRPLAG
jgi:TolB-like protein